MLQAGQEVKGGAVALVLEDTLGLQVDVRVVDLNRSVESVLFEVAL